MFSPQDAAAGDVYDQEFDGANGRIFAVEGPNRRELTDRRTYRRSPLQFMI